MGERAPTTTNLGEVEQHLRTYHPYQGRGTFPPIFTIHWQGD